MENMAEEAIKGLRGGRQASL